MTNWLKGCLDHNQPHGEIVDVSAGRFIQAENMYQDPGIPYTVAATPSGTSLIVVSGPTINSRLGPQYAQTSVSASARAQELVYTTGLPRIRQ